MRASKIDAKQYAVTIWVRMRCHLCDFECELHRFTRISHPKLQNFVDMYGYTAVNTVACYVRTILDTYMLQETM